MFVYGHATHLCDPGFVKSLPPDFRIAGPFPHISQFLLDLQQSCGPRFEGRLLQRGVLALIGIMGVHLLQVCDFLTKAREVFCKISHLFEHTPICWLSAGRGFHIEPNPVIYVLTAFSPTPVGR